MTIGDCRALFISSVSKLTLTTQTRPPSPKIYINCASPQCKYFIYSQVCKTQLMSHWIFPFSYVVKDFHTRIPLPTRIIYNNLYPMKTSSTLQNHVALVTHDAPLNLWHQCLGHPCLAIMSLLSSSLSPKSNVMLLVLHVFK